MSVPPDICFDEFLSSAVRSLPIGDRRDLARKYVESECTSDELLPKLAYSSLRTDERASLHQARAQALENGTRQEAFWGPILFHRCREGADPAVLLHASNRCMQLAYYKAALGWAQRGLEVHGTGRGSLYGALRRNLMFSHLMLGNLSEVEQICAEHREFCSDPELLARTAYAKSILYAKLYDPARRDLAAARAWAENALTFAAQVSNPKDRRVVTAFLKNALALIETRLGRFDIAEALLQDGLGELTRSAADNYEEERILLFHNLARLHTARHRPDRAIEQLTELLARRHDTSAYLDRGILHHRLTHYENALADFDAAIRWSPPYPEAHIWRALALQALGKYSAALDDYSRALVLAPGHAGALTNRAAFYYHLGNVRAARADVDEGLRHDPSNNRLLCLRGMLDMRARRLNEAYEDFSEAIRTDASLADAWANRGTVRFRQGDLTGALADLTRALELRHDPNAFYNRARILESCGREQEAVDDFVKALELGASDPEGIRARIAELTPSSIE